MNNEKVLSNDELLDVVGGANFMPAHNLSSDFSEKAVLTMKYGIYYTKPKPGKLVAKL